MTSPILNKVDAAVQTAIGALDDHVAAMITAGETAYRIQQEIRSGYVADSSRIFQGRVDAWIGSYNEVMRKFQALGDNTAWVNTLLDQAEDEAGVHGASWHTDDEIYAALAPTR
jgi:hypothetical protein